MCLERKFQFSCFVSQSEPETGMLYTEEDKKKLPLHGFYTHSLKL